jgi:hypothetical protein
VEADVVEHQDMSIEDAAAVMRHARATARRELVISAPVVYAAWGLVWILGYGAMWLSAHDQHPFRGPSGASIAAVFVLAGFAAATVLVVAHKAAAGIGGRSARDRRIVIAAWVAGFLILLLAQVAIRDSVSSRVLAFVGLAAPLVLAGMIYILASVLGRSRSALILGAWLVAAGVSCAWQAPADTLATCALAGGGGFLLTALIEFRLRTHDR